MWVGSSLIVEIVGTNDLYKVVDSGKRMVRMGVCSETTRLDATAEGHVSAL